MPSNPLITIVPLTNLLGSPSREGVTAVYNRHSYGKEKQDTLARRGDRLVEMTTPREEGARVAGSRTP